uniref:Uncharacterized protein n=1 Tax=Heterorhabditis bacteriophora TaxID=37862 RepID=A0A1I7W740_HETBA
MNHHVKNNHFETKHVAHLRFPSMHLCKFHYRSEAHKGQPRPFFMPASRLAKHS